MKNLRLKSIALVSHREKKAKMISFHPKVTILKGGNNRGKSAIIKSIFLAFGASPHSVHDRWVNSNVTIHLRFSIDDTEYSIFKDRNSYSLFDASDLLIDTYYSVTKDLAPALAKLFDFNLRLLNRQSKSTIPPPAFLMMPFYIDQDEGWKMPWNSFTNLNQFANWKRNVIPYHFGIRPDKWYQLDTEKKSVEKQKEEPERNLGILEGLRDKATYNLSRVDFDFDIDQFKETISRLLHQCDILKRQEQIYRDELLQFTTQKIQLTAQIEIVQRTRNELSTDFKFAVGLVGDSIECPTCGQEHTNSFAERYGLAADVESCTDILQSLKYDLTKVNAQIETVNNVLQTHRNKQTEIENLLASKKGKVILRDLVKLEGKRELLTQLDSEVEAKQTEIANIEIKIAEYERQMKLIDDAKSKKRITDRYKQELKRYCSLFGVDEIAESAFKTISPKLKESGSDQPRAILAYFFTALDAIKNGNNSTFFPIVIDAPNQQEQDEDHLDKILKFIPTSIPKNSQLILGLVNDAGVQFEGSEIIFENDKYHLLSENDYAALAEDLAQFEKQSLQPQS